jgi:hypothetical protein
MKNENPRRGRNPAGAVKIFVEQKDNIAPSLKFQPRADVRGAGLRYLPTANLSLLELDVLVHSARCEAAAWPGLWISRRQAPTLPVPGARGNAERRIEAAAMICTCEATKAAALMTDGIILERDDARTDPPRADAPDNWTLDADAFECCCAVCSSQNQ